MDNSQLAKELFAAFAKGDVDTARELCASDLQAVQNGGPAMGIEALLQFVTAVGLVVEDFRYEEAIRAATATGFVEEHLVRGTLPDGGELRLAACVVAEVEGGKVTALREYVDSAAAAGLLRALQA